MDASKAHLIKDQILRPWILNDPFDDLIKEECYELDKASRRTAPFKKAGDYGISSLDREPRELIEIEKLLLNLDSYPVITKHLKIDAKNVRHSAERPQTQEKGHHQNEVTPTSEKHLEIPMNHLAEILNLENGIRQIPSAQQPRSKHSVRRFVNYTDKAPKASIYGTTRRKASMQSVSYKSRKGPTVVDTSTESFHRFLQKQVRPWALYAAVRGHLALLQRAIAFMKLILLHSWQPLL
jgi:hypothetical protein